MATQQAIADHLVAAALATEGADVTMGPGRGRLACAWAVNRFVLQPVLGQAVGQNPNLVVSVRAGLLRGKADEVPAHQARPGDIAIAAGPGRSQHIGVVVPARKGKGVAVLSTQGGRWGWRSDLNFAMRYRVPSRIYRVRETSRSG